MKKLTQRQRQILLMALGGQSSTEIGRRLGLKPSTIKNTLSQSYRKIGVHRLADAALWAASVGLVELPEVQQ